MDSKYDLRGSTQVLGGGSTTRHRVATPDFNKGLANGVREKPWTLILPKRHGNILKVEFFYEIILEFEAFYQQVE